MTESGEENHIVFMGDSKARDQYHSFLRAIINVTDVKAQHDLKFDIQNLGLRAVSDSRYTYGQLRPLNSLNEFAWESINLSIVFDHPSYILRSLSV